MAKAFGEFNVNVRVDMTPAQFAALHEQRLAAVRAAIEKTSRETPYVFAPAMVDRLVRSAAQAVSELDIKRAKTGVQPEPTVTVAFEIPYRQYQAIVTEAEQSRTDVPGWMRNVLLIGVKMQQEKRRVDDDLDAERQAQTVFRAIGGREISHPPDGSRCDCGGMERMSTGTAIPQQALARRDELIADLLGGAAKLVRLSERLQPAHYTPYRQTDEEIFAVYMALAVCAIALPDPKGPADCQRQNRMIELRDFPLSESWAADAIRLVRSQIKTPADIDRDAQGQVTAQTLRQSIERVIGER